MNPNLADAHPSDALPGFIQWCIDLFSRVPLSIRAKLLLSFLIVILVSSSVNAMLVVRAMDYKRQYDVLISNITTANSINGYIKPAIDTEMWNIVKGETSFTDGRQYQILDEVNAKINMMSDSTDSESGRQLLEVIRRTMKTLRHYVDLLGIQMISSSTYDQNLVALDNIRGVSTLVEEEVQAYMLFEVNRTGKEYEETQANFAYWMGIGIIVLVGVTLVSIVLAWLISESIYIPIKKLHDVTATLTHEDLAVLAIGSHSDEITELGMSFNIMIGKIRLLLDDKIREQENLKKAEMRVLQAQINPHFLYNTLDTIISLVEMNRNSQVLEIVRALSNFFRITLSKGKDWISLREEIEHVRSYLTIQKVRYRDILEYNIEVDDDILDYPILKLTLQPLVENALYHGIKNKRGGGSIRVRGRRVSDGAIQIEVEDTGIGIPPDRLEEITNALKTSVYDDQIGEHGYGIYNVGKRLKLGYGAALGITIQSEYQHGTRITLLLPYNQPD
jgi:two-component system, sensor histidine kinase YesM